MTAMIVTSAMPAFAAPFPLGPGPNSLEAVFKDKGASNFGNCQSEFAKGPGSAESAQFDNPAIITKGDETGGGGDTCSK
jgi:hypothetical protein